MNMNLMASNEQELEGNENGLEFDKWVRGFGPSESDFLETLTNDGIEKKPESEEKTDELGRKITLALRENFSRIKSFVEKQWLQYSHGGDFEQTRVYHVWPGKHVFFFRGRLICGPDPRGLVLTSVSITLSSWIFAFYGGDDSPSRSSLIIIFSMILTVIALANLILVATTDPGIIPRNDQESSQEIGTSRENRRKEMMVNGVALKLKYCRICKIFRPPRSCHCAVCDTCVEKFDHHCPWIGQCIGLGNYRYYIACICSALVFFTYIFAFSSRRIHRRVVKTGIGLFGIVRHCPETLALASFSFAAIGFLGGLTIFHAYLIAINQTAYENFRQRYAGSRNPYSKGILSNIKEVLLVPLPPSRIDFQAEVMPRNVAREV